MSRDVVFPVNTVLYFDKPAAQAAALSWMQRHLIIETAIVCGAEITWVNGNRECAEINFHLALTVNHIEIAHLMERARMKDL